MQNKLQTNKKETFFWLAEAVIFTAAAYFLHWGLSDLVWAAWVAFFIGFNLYFMLFLLENRKDDDTPVSFLIIVYLIVGFFPAGLIGWGLSNIWLPFEGDFSFVAVAVLMFKKFWFLIIFVAWDALSKAKKKYDELHSLTASLAAFLFLIFFIWVMERFGIVQSNLAIKFIIALLLFMPPYYKIRVFLR